MAWSLEVKDFWQDVTGGSMCVRWLFPIGSLGIYPDLINKLNPRPCVADKVEITVRSWNTGVWGRTQGVFCDSDFNFYSIPNFFFLFTNEARKGLWINLGTALARFFIFWEKRFTLSRYFFPHFLHSDSALCPAKYQII